MRLQQIRDLVAVLNAGSIRAAARKLGLSQPAVTKSIRNLEAELHQQLLDRTPQGIKPTAAGRAFYARAQIIQSEVRKAHEDMARLSGEHAGSVAFGVGPLAASLVVPEAVKLFRQQHPQAHIRIVEGFAPALAPLVRDETLDFALGPRFDKSLDAALSFKPLFRERFVVVARRGHPLRKARSLAELLNADWLRLYGRLDTMFGAVGLPVPRQVVQCDSHNTMVSLLRNSDMLGTMGMRMLTTTHARDVLEMIPVREAAPVASIVMLVRPHAPFTPVAAAMAKAVITVARRLARPE